MLELDRILVIIEPGEESQPALEKAVQLAKYADSELELMISDYNAYLEDGYYFDPVQAQKMRYEHGETHIAEMEALAEPLRKQGLTITVTTAWGNPPYEEVVRRVNETKPSIVIKSTRHHNKLARLVLSNEDWELIRYCSAPLLLVKTHLWETSRFLLRRLIRIMRMTNQQRWIINLLQAHNPWLQFQVEMFIYFTLPGCLLYQVSIQ